MVKARGRLMHQFHGTYTAVVGLVFDTPEDAHAAHTRLGDTWVPSHGNPKALVWQGGDESLEQVKQALAHATIDPCGWKHCRGQCKRAPIDSIAHSVDYGPSFTVEL